MTANNPRYDRLTHAELPRERRQVLPGLASWPPLFHTNAATPTNLIGMLACQFRVSTTLLVDVLRYGFEMCRVDAAAVRAAITTRARLVGGMAEMVNLKVVRDILNEELVVEPRGWRQLLINGVPHLAVAPLTRAALPDPTRRLVAQVFEYVAVLKWFKRPMRSVVTADETDGLAAYPSFGLVGVRRDRRGFSAIAHAPSRWVRAIWVDVIRPQRFGSQLRVVPTDKADWLTLDIAAPRVRVFGDGRASAASAVTRPVRDWLAALLARLALTERADGFVNVLHPGFASLVEVAREGPAGYCPLAPILASASAGRTLALSAAQG